VSVSIRPYAGRDLAFRQRVASRLDPGETASPRDREAMRRYFEAFGRGEHQETGDAFVAVDEADLPLGLLILHAEQDYFTGHPRAYVDILVVDEAAEGRGVGRALMVHAERWAREHGCAEVCLDVFATKPDAIAFYERLDFRADHIRMAKPVTPE
jgi:GNAT superfamily N-acetyltransferase